MGGRPTGRPTLPGEAHRGPSPPDLLVAYGCPRGPPAAQGADCVALPIGWQEDLGDEAAGAFSVGYYVSPWTVLPDLVISSGEACALDDGFAGRDQTRFLVPRRSGIEARHDSVSVRLLVSPPTPRFAVGGLSLDGGTLEGRWRHPDPYHPTTGSRHRSPVPNGTTPGEFDRSKIPIH